ncbi:hypothetical protein, partial [Streptomyces sp. NPDC054838]
MDDAVPVPPPAEKEAERAVLIASQLKERLYATITMIAVVVGLAYSGHGTPGGVAVSVAGTAVGLWLATLVADWQAHRVVHGRGSGERWLRETLFVSTPLLLSAAGPLLMILLSALGVVALHTALLAAAAVDVWVLFGWGWYGGRPAGGRRVRGDRHRGRPGQSGRPLNPVRRGPAAGRAPR